LGQDTETEVEVDTDAVVVMIDTDMTGTVVAVGVVVTGAVVTGGVVVVTFGGASPSTKTMLVSLVMHTVNEPDLGSRNIHCSLLFGVSSVTV